MTLINGITIQYILYPRSWIYIKITYLISHATIFYGRRVLRYFVKRDIHAPYSFIKQGWKHRFVIFNLHIFERGEISYSKNKSNEVIFIFHFFNVIVKTTWNHHHIIVIIGKNSEKLYCQTMPHITFQYILDPFSPPPWTMRKCDRLPLHGRKQSQRHNCL